MNPFLKPSLALFSLVITGLVAMPSGKADVTVSSDPVGYYRVPLTPGFQTVGMTLVNSPTFVTLVESSNSNSITSTESVDVGALLDVEQAYYVEVVAGPASITDAHVGHRFEVNATATIDGGTSDGVVILNIGTETSTVFSLPDLAGYRIELRKHITLAEAFPKGSLYANFDFGLADQVQIYNGASFTAYFLFGGNNEGDSKFWVNFGATEVVDDLPILPGQGMLYKRSTAAPAGGDLVMSGKVRANPFYQRLDPGFNFVSEAYPVSTNFTQRAAAPPHFVPNFDVGLADQVQEYIDSKFVTYFLAGNASSSGWFTFPSFTPSDSAMVFDYQRSVFIKRSTATTAYRIPLGWTPTP